jgi:1,4-dihydroxy-2-naphthoyl-CoA hydrolase
MTPTEIVHSSMPLCATLGVTASEFTADRVVLDLAWRPDLCTGGDVLHGGTLMALADSAGAACAFLNLPEGATGTTTIESKTNFLGAVRQGDAVAATATLLHRGNTTIVVETELRTTDGRLIAKTTQTQAVLRPRNP